MINNHKETITLSIVVPVFNSAATLPILTERIHNCMTQNGIAYELLLVDDFSSDDSWTTIKQLSAKYSQITGLKLAQNYGQWSATLAGMSKTKGQFIVTIDDDMEYQPEDIFILYQTILDQPVEIVFGIAENKYKAQGKNPILAKIRNILLNLLWNKPQTDSFKILYRNLVFQQNSFLVHEHFESFLNRMLPSNKWGYAAVNYKKRLVGNSNHTFFKKAKLFFLFSYHYLTTNHRSIHWTIEEEFQISPNK